MRRVLKKQSAENLKNETLEKNVLNKYSKTIDGFFTSKIEEITPFIKFPIPPSKLEGTTIIFITEGKLNVILEEEQFCITPNNILVIQADKIFSVNDINLSTKGFACYFETFILTGELEASILVNKLEYLEPWGKSIFILNKIENNFIKNIYERLYHEYFKNELNHDIVRSYIKALLIEIYSLHENEKVLHNKSA